MKPFCLRPWLIVCALCFALLGSTSAQTLINVNVGFGEKIGTAAAGTGTNDYWNAYNPTDYDGSLFDPGSLVPLYSADGTNTVAGLMMFNVYTNGANATGDTMFDSWLAASGTNLFVTLTNLPYGAYDIYVYGHGDSNELNSIINLAAAWSDFGTTNTTTSGGWNTNVWTEGAEYVVFRDVLIPWGRTCRSRWGPTVPGWPS